MTKAVFYCPHILVGILPKTLKIDYTNLISPNVFLSYSEKWFLNVTLFMYFWQKFNIFKSSNYFGVCIITPKYTISIVTLFL